MANHIHPTADLAERVLLPGDPGRALRLAQALIDGPRMFNHHRGLWGYSGPARHDGALLSIQSTGMGGPSAAIVISELIDLGARRLVRIGTCGGLDATLELGSLLVGTEVICDDGASRAMGAGARVAPCAALTDALCRAAEALPGAAEPPAGSTATSLPGPATSFPGTATSFPGTATSSGPIVSTDLFYGAEVRERGWRAAGARAVEMEAATLCTLARRRGVAAGVLLIVSDLLVGPGAPVRVDEPGLLGAELRLGASAVTALAQSAQQSQPA